MFAGGKRREGADTLESGPSVDGAGSKGAEDTFPELGLVAEKDEGAAVDQAAGQTAPAPGGTGLPSEQAAPAAKIIDNAERPAPTPPGVDETAEGAEPAADEAAMPGTEPAATTGPATETAAPSPADDVDTLVLRSTNVIGTLADIAAHAEAPAELLTLIERSGLAEWKDAPRVQARMLARNGHWWLWSENTLDNAAYDRMMAVELLLNVADDLRYRTGDAAEPLEERVRTVLRGIDALMPLAVPNRATRFYAKGAREGGEWAARLSLADFAESLPAPLRVAISLQVNVADGIAVIDAEVPRPGVFAAVEPTEDARAAACRGYAMRLCLALGRGAFGSAAGISRVVVNGHENGTRTPVISLDLTRAGLDRLRTEMASAPTGELPRGLGIRWFTSADGRLAPVEPFLAVWDDAVAPLTRWSGLEDMNLPAPEAVSASCKARTVSDLGINEKAVRIDAWNEATGWLGATTRRAVAAFEARRRAASDATVAEACERVSRALVAGELDVFDRGSMAYLFVEGGKLATTVRGVSQQINARPAHTSAEVEAALASLESALEPAAQTARYADDTERVFRYFNSVAERVHYNLECQDDGRELRLVPDEYYAAHSQAAQLLVALGRHEEALSHADELVRVGPYTTDAALSRVRCLEELSRIYEAIDQLKLAIERVSTVQEMAVCIYRLAFMEWKLGHGKTSVACYARAAELPSQIRDRALSEMDDVLSADHALRRLSGAEARRAIEDAGLPYGDVDGLRKMMRDAAVACTDAGLLAAARPLTAVLLEAEQDDVLLDVYTSLVPARPQ